MTEDERLLIKQLSKHGELLDCINCFPGKITVLRSESESDLLPYRQAVSGQVSGKKFVVTYRSLPFDPSKHMVIGFGSFLPTDKTVSQLLEQVGLPAQKLPAFLPAFGLEGVISHPVSKLSADLLRRVELIYAAYSTSRVLVLDSPFEPLSSLYRDRFAELILSTTESKRLITLVTRLTYRPEQWVGNHSVERVQVGSTIQKTVGFSSNDEKVKELITQIRGAAELPSPGSFGESKDVSEPNKADLSVYIKRLQPLLKIIKSSLALMKPLLAKGGEKLCEGLPRVLEPKTLRTLSMGVTGFAVFLITLLLTTERGSYTTQEVAKNTPAASLPTNTRSASGVATNVSEKSPTDKPLLSSKSRSHADNPIKQAVAKSPPTNSAPKVMLDAYSPEIRRAVMDAFKNNAVEKPVVVRQAPTSRSPIGSDNIFEALKNLQPSEDVDNTPSQLSFESMGAVDDETLKDRQQEIRRRFLEALQRAADREHQD